jgi:hypothetical protein
MHAPKLLLLLSVGVVLMKKTTMRNMSFASSAALNFWESKKPLLLAATPQTRHQINAQ